MSGITIPTLDEITGHTVMAKLRSLCKRFIGLAEEVDEKIDAPLEEAHLAVQTANTTLATAQESLEDAQSAVTTANSASATANEASESAQESAETVAGYDTRLSAVELKVQTAEGNIVTIQGQITALQTADGENVKLTGEHAIGNYAVLLTGNQGPIAGNKDWVGNNTFDVSGTFARPMTIKNTGMDVYSTEAIARSWIWVVDQNDAPVWIVSFNQEGTHRYVNIRTYKSDGTYTQTALTDVTG